ncbi:DUF2891 domain-containing protein [Kordiimonas lipolytica]|uniref:DUF2891 domain-containing protein n=1 Tax=Kordiimonas lipolytica TaxID=1662421 RepID=A0ABV8UDL9_9PROT
MPVKKSALTLALLGGLTLTACDDGAKHDTADISLPPAREGVVTDRFARMALGCIHREYPNKISHVLNSDADVGAPRDLTPAFYGCFDWHSSVHGHWLLVRLIKQDPEGPFAEIATDALAESFTAKNIEAEVAYYMAEGRKGFERPYGIAWYLQLVAELHESSDPLHQKWRETLRPLEDAIVAKMTAWLPKLAYPVRLGTHNQSAFAFGLMLDYARTVDDGAFEALLTERTLDFYEDDTSCPIGYEPSGEDFLSPCLMEADLMRRVMNQADFAVWLGRFLPRIPRNGKGDWLEPAIVKDATDGKLVHLDGVNLSRAWALEGIASALPQGDPRKASLLAAASIHKDTGIKAVSDEHYAGSHWLASFATYLETKRGINENL